MAERKDSPIFYLKDMNGLVYYAHAVHNISYLIDNSLRSFPFLLHPKTGFEKIIEGIESFRFTSSPKFMYI